MDITLIDETTKVTASQQAEIEKILQFAAAELELAESTEMSVTFMDNQGIQIINRDQLMWLVLP